MKRASLLISITILGLLSLILYCEIKCYTTYKEYHKLDIINKEYISLKKDIKRYERAIEDIKLVKEQEVDSKKKFDELNDKVSAIKKEIEKYKTNIVKLNKELNIK